MFSRQDLFIIIIIQETASIPKGGLSKEGVDEDEAHATRMDDWIVWEAGEETERAGSGGFPMSWACTQGRRPVSLVLVYIPLRGERTYKRE
jgi:hypothetical protein